MKSIRFLVLIPLRGAFFFFLFLAVISCRKQIDFPAIASGDSINSNTNPNADSMDTAKITYLALGDSYTIGQSVSESERFPVQLVNILRKENVNVQNPDIIAVTGWVTGNLLDALKTSQLKHDYTFVTLLIGVNNQYQGRPLEEYKRQFSQLLDSAIHFAGNKNKHVFVLSIPDYSVTPFAEGSDQQKIAMEIDEFNEANYLISQNAGVHYLDITPISRDAKNDPSLIAIDGLHPSSGQYLKWDQLLAPLLLQEIK